MNWLWPCDLWTPAAPWRPAAPENPAPLLSPARFWVKLKKRFIRRGSLQTDHLSHAEWNTEHQGNIFIQQMKGENCNKILKSCQNIKLEQFPGVCVCVFMCATVFSIPRDNLPGSRSGEKKMFLASNHGWLNMGYKDVSENFSSSRLLMKSSLPEKLK